MTNNSLGAVGPVLAADLGLWARGATARRHDDAETVTVEVVRPVDARKKLLADADATRSVPTTERLLIDISV